MKTILVKDNIKTFIPKSRVNYVILGTMASSCARMIDNVPPEEAFYYHNKKNQFWKILSYIFYGELRAIDTIIERQNFLEKFGIAMANIVESAEVPELESNNSSDDILFEAYNLKKLEVKSIADEFKNLLLTKPIFFTCKHKMPLACLLENYFRRNELGMENILEKIHFLPSPTRCSPEVRSRRWKEMGLALKK